MTNEMKSALVVVLFLALGLQQLSNVVVLATAQDAGLQPETSDEECPQELKDASSGDDILNEVPCFKIDKSECATVATYYEDCGMCCPPGEKPKVKGCMKWKENVGEGSYCGPVGVAPLRYDACKADSICNGNSKMESYLTCVKKPDIDEFDCNATPDADNQLTDLLNGTSLTDSDPDTLNDLKNLDNLDNLESFGCGHYIHKGHPMECKVDDEGVGRCTEVPRPGDSCNDDEDESPFRCEDEGMICLDGACSFLEEDEKCGDSAEDGFENANCAPGLECTKRGSKLTSSGLYAFGEEVENGDETVCIRKLLGGEPCGYPGKGCVGSAFCLGAPNGKEDDPRSDSVNVVNNLESLGTSMKQVLLRCGVFCEGKMSKIDFFSYPGTGDCVCTDETRCNFNEVFDGLQGATTPASDPCPDNEETKEKLANDWKGKTGSCQAPAFLNIEHQIGDSCFTLADSPSLRACENGGQWSGPDTKCDQTTTCVDRKLGVTGTFKRVGFLEDFDFGNSCSFNEDDADDFEEIEDKSIDCVCGPKGKAVWQKSYAPQDDGTAFWCSAIGVLHDRCLQKNKCAEEDCGPCRGTYEEKVIDCSRPKASISPLSYFGATYVLGADPNFKNRRFIGAFFGVFFALCFLIAGCCFGCKKCRDKRKAKAEADGDGESKGNAVVPAKGDQA